MAKSMRTAFIRVSTSNNTKQGLVVYSLNDMKRTLENWSTTTDMTYWLIEHKADEDIDLPHFHIVIKMKNPTPKTSFISKFPYSDIQSARNIKSCVQYLVHLNDSTKTSYGWDEIVTNCSDMAKYKVKSASQDEVTLQSILDKIDSGEIREFNQFEMIPINLWAKYKTRIENALTYYRERICMDKNREIQVQFLTGDTGTGKTTFAKDYCEKMGLSYCITSSSNDPMQDYKGEDVLIMDDLRDSDYTFTDLLKTLDNHTHSTVRSRYHNKAFIGRMIIITSYKPLTDWYPNIDEDSRQQLFRRIQSIQEFTKTHIKVYQYDPLAREYKYLATAPNITLMQFEQKKSMAINMLESMGVELSIDVKKKLEDMDETDFIQVDTSDLLGLPFGDDEND